MPGNRLRIIVSAFLVIGLAPAAANATYNPLKNPYVPGPVAKKMQARFGGDVGTQIALAYWLPVGYRYQRFTAKRGNLHVYYVNTKRQAIDVQMLRLGVRCLSPCDKPLVDVDSDGDWSHFATYGGIERKYGSFNVKGYIPGAAMRKLLLNIRVFIAYDRE